jgi:hypothetical protein
VALKREVFQDQDQFFAPELRRIGGGLTKRNFPGTLELTTREDACGYRAAHAGFVFFLSQMVTTDDVNSSTTTSAAAPR